MVYPNNTSPPPPPTNDFAPDILKMTRGPPEVRPYLAKCRNMVR